MAAEGVDFAVKWLGRERGVCSGGFFDLCSHVRQTQVGHEIRIIRPGIVLNSRKNIYGNPH